MSLKGKTASGVPGKGLGNRFGHLDILANNSGANVRERAWSELSPAGTSVRSANAVHTPYTHRHREDTK